MNYYKRHLGDYAKNTRTLNTYEHGVYNLLLDLYYTDEEPITAEDAYDICRAESDSERASVEKVLRKYFIADGGRFRHERADEEIAEYRAQAETNRRIAVEREAKKRARKENVTTTNVERTEHDSCTNHQPSHKPLAISQEEAKASELRSPVGSEGEASPEVPDCPHEAIIAAYHRILPECRRVRTWDNGRQSYLRQRWREDRERQSLEWWEEFFSYVRRCPFLLGQQAVGDRDPFLADLEWLVRPQNFRKVIEGKYERRAS